MRRETPEGPRRAVVFLSELVPRPAIAAVARLAYNEPYRALPMRATTSRTSTALTLRYEWRERDWVGFEGVAAGPPAALRTGSLAEFITEHFWGYTIQRDGGTVEYQVEHPSWRVWEAPTVRVLGDLSATYGAAFGSILAGAPHSAFVAEGSPIVVHRPRRLTTESLPEPYRR